MLKGKYAIGLLFIGCFSINFSSFDRGIPFSIVNPSWAQERPKQIRGTKDGVIVGCEMYVMGKTVEGVIISEELFRILPSTVILDAERRKITLWELKEPCTAFVEYSLKTDESSPTIIRLQLLGEPQGSTTRRKIGRRGKNVGENSVK